MLYFLFGDLIEASLMRRYHNKLLDFVIEGCRYNARQKSRRWAVLGVLLIVGKACRRQ